MNLKKLLITGTFGLVMMFMVGLKPTYADFCSPGEPSTHYKSVYCTMQKGNKVGGGEVNQEILKLISKQFDLEEEMINQILDGTACDTVAKMKEEERKKVPEKVLIACTTDEMAAEKKFLAQNLFLDIQNSFQKEKALFFNKTALKMKFKASEQYWDGKVGAVDAPFDLMTDLNLIDVTLFGSKAKWNGDVYNFPKTEEGSGNEPVKLDEMEQNDLNQNNKPNLPQNPPAPDCVPAEDPEAGPNSKAIKPECGNGSFELLLGEQCDDGNKKSGDGCNQFCQKEENGSNNLCQDPEAITFKQPLGQAEAENVCPPNFVPKKNQNSSNNEVTQVDGYPGPFIGGILKQFPASARPLCGPGKSPLEIMVAGKKVIDKDSNGNPRCLPTKLCSDPDKVRSFLAATSFPFPVGAVTAAEWKSLPENDPIRQALEAVDVVACVNVIKENRPGSFYNPNEGCIDCHLRAIVDALEETLTTNVTPLANTTKAFGLSTRFGPNFSFNLMTTLKPKLKLTETNTAAKAVEDSDAALKKAVEDALKPSTPLPNPENDINNLTVKAEQEKQIAIDIAEDLKGYNRSGGAIAEIELIRRVEPLIGQMRTSFETIQSQYQEMVDETSLDDTPPC